MVYTLVTTSAVLLSFVFGMFYIDSYWLLGFWVGLIVLVVDAPRKCERVLMVQLAKQEKPFACTQRKANLAAGRAHACPSRRQVVGAPP